MGIVMGSVRAATVEDTEAIASLHAESWRVSYRGALSDQFLDSDEVVQNRLRVWQERLGAPVANRLVTVVEDGGSVIAFACAIGAQDPLLGTLLDNIHVRGDEQGRGTGKQLMAVVADWAMSSFPGMGLFLRVLEQNTRARRFYERLGGADVDGDVWAAPGGGLVPRRIYAWPGNALSSLRAPGAPRPLTK